MARGREGARARAVAALAWGLALGGCYGSAPGAGAPDDAGADAAPTADTRDAGEPRGPDAGPWDADPDGGPVPEDAVPSTDGPGDAAAPDGEPPGPCDPGAPAEAWSVTVPLGETLFFDGDDYLAFWGTDLPCPVTVEGRPEGALAEPVTGAGGAQRLTPDAAGAWVLRRGASEVALTVDAAWLSPDTFLNYNYTPTTPLAVPAGDAALWVASPRSNAVHRVALAGGEPTPAELVPTGAWPTALAAWDDAGLLLVAQTGRDTLGFVDVASRRLVDAVRVGNEPAGLALALDDPAGPSVWVALSGEDAVARVDLATRQVTARVGTGRDPRALALAADGRLFAASLVSGNAHPRGLLQAEPVPAEALRDVTVIDTATAEAVAVVPEVGTVLRGLALTPDGTGLLVAASHSHNDRATIDADAGPISHALVRVDVDPTSPGLYGVADEIDLDGQPTSAGPAASPFSIAWLPGGEHLAVTLSAGRAILLLDAATLEEVARLPAGSDPRGLVVADGRLWSFAWLDGLLQGWPLPGGDGAAVEVTVGDDPAPLEVRQGQRMFNDASFSRHGDFSCNNCHVDGLTDGLVWNLLVDGDVNTLAFRNVGGTSPFLWGGQLPTLFDFSREVLKLVGAEASGAQMQLLTVYMQSVTAPPNPWTRPGGRLTPEAEAGRALFEAPVDAGGAGCADCHGGPLLTSRVRVEGKTPGLLTDVPSLFNAYDTAPYGRQGQWRTLEEMVAFAAGFTGAELGDEALAALTAYVRQQPSNALYPTSVRPLDTAAHVWVETPVEVVFSGVLRPGQEAAFTFERLADDGAGEPSPVPGAWAVQGRAARFTGEGPLAPDVSYRIRVAAGLEGVFGEQLGAPLDLRFHTGGEPALDVSGTWDLTLCEKSFGCAGAEVALLQAVGGQVTGVLLSSFDEGSLDHLEGVVDGDVLAIDPFVIDASIGPIYVDHGITATMADTNADGFAETGAGQVPFEIFGGSYLIDVSFQRTAYPKE